MKKYKIWHVRFSVTFISATGVSPSAAAAVSTPEVCFHSAFFLNFPVLMTFSKVNTYLTQPDEGHLARSQALKGAAAEAAKASFKAHRAEVAGKDELSATSSRTPLTLNHPRYPLRSH